MLSDAHLGRREIWPDIGAALVTRSADKPRLDIRKPHVIGPLVRRDCDVMAAAIVRAVDQHAANTGGAHFSEGDLLQAVDLNVFVATN